MLQLCVNHERLRTWHQAILTDPEKATNFPRNTSVAAANAETHGIRGEPIFSVRLRESRKATRHAWRVHMRRAASFTFRVLLPYYFTPCMLTFTGRPRGREHRPEVHQRMLGRLRSLPSRLRTTSRVVTLSQSCQSSSNAMAMKAPVDRLNLVTPFPHGRATDTTLRLHEIAAGRPCVLHLFTG